MSFGRNLGKVKGDKGTAYIPQITKENGKLYISYTSNDNTEVPEELSKKPLTSYVYKPVKTQNNELSFELTDTSILPQDSGTINFGSIKGEPGNALIHTKVVNEVPNYTDLSQEEKDMIDGNRSLIYIIDTGEAYLDSGIFHKKDGTIKFVYLENKIRFNNYYTIEETYNRNELYNKNEIDTLLNNVKQQQIIITRMLNDGENIVIMDDETGES